MRTIIAFVLASSLYVPPLFTQDAGLPTPVRIDSGVSGHIHPSLAVTPKGTLVAVYCRSEYKPHLITRSTDGGKTWSKPLLFPPTAKTQVYPGSLTTLAGGRLVHAWNVWFEAAPKVKSRHVAFSISSDDGVTWSEPKNLAKNKDPKVESVIRHPLVELGPARWLIPLADRTIVYNPQTGEERPFGDGRNHGLVPIVRTVNGTFVSGKGVRSTDDGKTWQDVKPFPDVSSQGWRHEMIGLKNGWLLASQIVGPGFGGDKINFILSRDDGQSWDLQHPVEFYNPGRAIGGRACPRTVEMDGQTLGTIFYDIDAKQPGGAGVFFRAMPTARLAQAAGSPKDFTNALGMKFVYIPPGRFMMGSSGKEKGRGDDEIVRQVTFTKGLYLGVYTVTAEQWQSVMGSNPSYFKGAKNLPVEQVSWDDCQAFCQKLSGADKKRYRLPTEAEWEYACRAGTTTAFHCGATLATDEANYNGNFTYGAGKKGVYREKTTPVGSFPANAWGLHDMHGNVWQWCQDWHGGYSAKDVVDPQGPKGGKNRVLRGGSWGSHPIFCRSANRNFSAPDSRTEFYGLRICFSEP